MIKQYSTSQGYFFAKIIDDLIESNVKDIQKNRQMLIVSRLMISNLTIKKNMCKNIIEKIKANQNFLNLSNTINIILKILSVF